MLLDAGFCTENHLRERGWLRSLAPATPDGLAADISSATSPACTDSRGVATVRARRRRLLHGGPLAGAGVLTIEDGARPNSAQRASRHTASACRCERGDVAAAPRRQRCIAVRVTIRVQTTECPRWRAEIAVALSRRSNIVHVVEQRAAVSLSTSLTLAPTCRGAVSHVFWRQSH